MSKKEFDFMFVRRDCSGLTKFLTDLDYQVKVMECLYGVHEVLKGEEYEDMLAMR